MRCVLVAKGTLVGPLIGVVMLGTVTSSGVAGAATPSPSASPLQATASVSDGVMTRTLLGPLEDDPIFDEEEGEFSPTEVVDIAAGGPGFVAVGRAPRGSVVWLSPDGASWERAPDSVALDDDEMWAIAAGGPGLVAVGSDGVQAAAWTSSDGRTWRRVRDTDFATRGTDPSRGELYPTSMSDVTRLADGSLVAVGWSHGLGCGCGGSSGEGTAFLDSWGPKTLGFTAWRSRDGSEWQRLPRSGGRRYTGDAISLVAFRKGWVALGWGRQVVLSTDGRSWGAFGLPVRLAGLAVTEDGLVGVGSLRRRDRESLWTSTDGRTWRDTGIALPVEVAASELLATGDGSLLVFTQDKGTSAGAVIWRLADGAAAWQRLDSGLPDEGSVDAAAATSDGRFVAVGRLGRDQPRLPAAWAVPAVEGADLDRPAPARAPWVEPVTPPWTTVAGVEPRGGVSAVRLADGRVLLAGGYLHAASESEGSQRYLAAELLDVGSGTLTRTTDLPHPTEGAAATLGPDDLVYLITELGRGRIGLRFDPADGSWTELEGRITDLWDSSTAWLPDGRLLIAPRLQYQPSMAIYDPATGRITSPAVRFDSIQLVNATDGGVYSFTRSRAWRRDPQGRWTPGAANAHLLWGGWGELVLVPLADGRLAVLIPGVQGPDLGRRHTLLDLYDPASDTWTQGAALPQPRYGFAAVQVPDGRLLIVGSHDASHDPAILVEVPAPDGSL